MATKCALESVSACVIATRAKCAAARPSKRPRPPGSSNSRITCNVRIRSDLDTNAPVFFKNGQLEFPSRGEFDWSQNETQISRRTLSSVTINTSSGSVVAPPPSVRSSVNKKNIGDVETTKHSCAGSWRLRLIGFKSKSNFLKLFESCVDEANDAVLYTHHQLYGAEIKSKSISQRIDFTSESFPNTANPRTAYAQNEQADRLAKLLNSPSAAKKYVNTTSFLHRGHLTPDGDQLLNTWQWAT
ncbi:uncharacterized protein LOC129720437 [Wyeomyia smithii]|uniref:uncharacterized protein LOC129720437 n=1 Tax=Wyeomyia smithii TaxID=174621 RepID=UPI0024681FA2|nr:uncharacterized protein LOC129720437 [Wyeomyia smithii]